MQTLWQDLRFGARMLMMQPGFTLIAVITLALGIGANTAMFSIVDALLLRAPAHVLDAEQVVRIYPRGSWRTESRSFSDYADLRDGTHSFSALAAYQGNVQRATGRGLEARQLIGTRVTASFFPLLGVKPALGRFFTAEEDRTPHVAQVVVISYELWQRQFGGAAEVIGKQLELGGRNYTIIGVAPTRFTGVELASVDFWYPISTMYGEEGWKEPPYERGSAWLNVIARLKPGMTLTTAEADANLANQRGWAASRMRSEGLTMRLGPVMRAQDAERSKEVRVTLWLVWVAATVLLIACANVANLLHARISERQREVAVRLALGATRLRIVRQFLTESLLLALAGSLCAVALAIWLAPLLRAFVLPENALALQPDLRVLAFTGVLALLTALICGLIPTWQASRCHLNSTLKTGAGNHLTHRSRMRSVLLIGQVALTFVLLVGAGLFVRSLREVSRLDLGIDTGKLLILTARLDLASYDEPQSDVLWQQMRERLQRLPSVEGVTLTTGAPFRFGWPQQVFKRDYDGKTQQHSGRDAVEAWLWCITPDFFPTTGIKLLRGRNFNEAERAGAAPVVIVNETLAHQLGQGREMLGEFVHLQIDRAPLAQIVGIAADSQNESVLGEKTPQFYVPFEQPLAAGRIPYRALLIRSAERTEVLIETVRREMHAALPGLPFLDITSMRRDIEPQLQAWRLGSSLFSIFGLLALSIASVGVYGLLAYSVAQRTREIGIRLALGAQMRDVLNLVIRQGIALVVVGLIIGLGLALALTRLVANQLYGVSATDPVTFAVIVLLMGAVSLAACYIPARRATKVDPLISLRCE
jgi:predicted permease